jgi:oxygen-independent coproporphyrinogen-3 oxidase
MSQQRSPQGGGIDPELLARYNRPGPRYTSYPTAPHFDTVFGPDQYAQRLAEANRRSDDPLSLYVHIPFCEHRCLYCGCHVVITRREDVVTQYLQHLQREIRLVAEALPDRRDVLQLHWGGGTPTHLTPEEIRELFAVFTECFALLPEAEVAVEIDPRVTTREHIDTLAELGFNRLSMGVQDFTPEVQEAVERNQTLEQTRELIGYCRKVGFLEFNVDLIYGLPRQTVERFEKSAREVLALNPGRVAVYSYAHVPWIRPQQKKIDEGDLPTTDTKFALFATALSTFTAAGYVQIGMDHFARPDDELARAQAEGKLTRNFMGYTVKAAPDLIAFGISGIGEVAGAFAQNAKKLSTYYRMLDDGNFAVDRGYVLDEDDRIRRFVIQSVMCNFELDFQTLRQRFGIEYDEYFEKEDRALADSIEPQFYERTSSALRITPAGQLFVRNICMLFDRYLEAEGGQAGMYSKTV